MKLTFFLSTIPIKGCWVDEDCGCEDDTYDSKNSCHVVSIETDDFTPNSTSADPSTSHTSVSSTFPPSTPRSTTSVSDRIDSTTRGSDIDPSTSDTSFSTTPDSTTRGSDLDSTTRGSDLDSTTRGSNLDSGPTTRGSDSDPSTSDTSFSTTPDSTTRGSDLDSRSVLTPSSGSGSSPPKENLSICAPICSSTDPLFSGTKNGTTDEIVDYFEGNCERRNGKCVYFRYSTSQGMCVYTAEDGFCSCKGDKKFVYNNEICQEAIQEIAPEVTMLHPGAQKTNPTTKAVCDAIGYTGSCIEDK